MRDLLPVVVRDAVFRHDVHVSMLSYETNAALSTGSEQPSSTLVQW